MSSIYDDVKSSFRSNVLMKIIIINIAIFLVLNIAHLFAFFGRFEKEYAMFERTWFYLSSPIENNLYKPWVLISYFFTHKDIGHIFWNMMFLYVFGSILGDFLGDKKVLITYILGGLAGAVMFFLIAPFVPNLDKVTFMLGASAGVYAIVFGTATLVPTYSLQVLFLGAVQIRWIALFYLVGTIIGLRGGNAGGELAHLGGILIGYIYISQLQRGRDIGAWIGKILDFFGNLFSKKTKKNNNYNQSKVKVNSNASNAYQKKNNNSSNNVNSNLPNQAEIDAILDKISQVGFHKLSPEEKEKLDKFSGQ